MVEIKIVCEMQWRLCRCAHASYSVDSLWEMNFVSSVFYELGTACLCVLSVHFIMIRWLYLPILNRIHNYNIILIESFIRNEPPLSTLQFIKVPLLGRVLINLSIAKVLHNQNLLWILIHFKLFVWGHINIDEGSFAFAPYGCKSPQETRPRTNN